MARINPTTTATDRHACGQAPELSPRRKPAPARAASPHRSKQANAQQHRFNPTGQVRPKNRPDTHGKLRSHGPATSRGSIQTAAKPSGPLPHQWQKKTSETLTGNRIDSKSAIGERAPIPRVTKVVHSTANHLCREPSGSTGRHGTGTCAHGFLMHHQPGAGQQHLFASSTITKQWHHSLRNADCEEAT